MTINRSIYTIDVDDSKFKKFKELFDKYQAELKKLPEGWRSINEAMAGAALAAEGIHKHSQGQNKNLHEQGENIARATALSRAAAVAWSGITSSAGTSAKYILKATSSLLRWSTFTAVLSGLLGGGALFGIERLASSINSQRRNAMGLGISYGQQASFNSNYNQLINPGSLLSNISTAKYNATSPQYTALMAAGFSQPDINNGNAATLAADLLKPGGKLDRLFPHGMQPGLIGPKANALGIDNLMPMQDLIAFINASPEEKARLAKQNADDASKMDLKEESQRKWADLITQLGLAAGQVEATFGEKFARYAPQLENLSGLFVKVVGAFAQSPLVKEGIESLATGIDKLAAFVDTDEFKDDVESLVKWIGEAAKSVWGFVSSFSGIKPPPANADALPPLFLSPEGGPSSSGAMGLGGGGSSPFSPPSLRDIGRNASPPTPIAGPSSWQGLKVTPGDNYSTTIEGLGTFPNTSEGHIAFDRAYAARIGIDPDFAESVARNEGAIAGRGANFASSVDIDPATGQPFSFGDYQLNVRNGLGVTARQSGIDPANPNDWARSNMFSLDWMRHHGISPWNGDRGVEQWRSSGRLPTIYIRPQTGSNVPVSGAMLTNPFTSVSN